MLRYLLRLYYRWLDRPDPGLTPYRFAIKPPRYDAVTTMRRTRRARPQRGRP